MGFQLSDTPNRPVSVNFSSFDPPTFLTDLFDGLNNNTTHLITMPSVDVMDSVPATSAKEAVKSVGVLEELIKSLSISKTQDETSAAAGNIASLLNGPTEERDLPTK